MSSPFAPYQRSRTSGLNHHWKSFWAAARDSFAYEQTYSSRADFLRMATAFVIVAGVALALEPHFALAGILLPFVGALQGCLMTLFPRNHSRFAVSAMGVTGLMLACMLGMALTDLQWVVYALLFTALFVAGMSRAISAGTSLRLLFPAMAIGAASELAPNFHTGLKGLAGVFVGALIVVLCNLLPPYRNRFDIQRTAIAFLYSSIAELAEGQRNSVLSEIIDAREKLLVLRSRQRVRVAAWFGLVRLGEQLAAKLSTTPLDKRASFAPVLRDIGDAVTQGSTLPNDRLRIGASDLDAMVNEILILTNTPLRAPKRSGRHFLWFNRPEGSGSSVAHAFSLIRNNLKWQSPVFRYALRLAIVGVLCHAIGIQLGEWGHGIAHHGFWVLIAGCLVAMPDYRATMTRGVARTIGSVIGAILGSALALIPGYHTPYIYAGVTLVMMLAILVFRATGQLYVMLCVVAWIAFLLGGEEAAFTRAVDTLIGGLVAMAVYLLLPTWQSDRLPQLFSEWSRLQGRYLGLVATAWAEGTAVGGEEQLRSKLHNALRPAQEMRDNFNRAAEDMIHEPRAHLSPWSGSTLTKIRQAITNVSMNSIIVANDIPTQGEPKAAALPSVLETWMDDIANNKTISVPDEAPIFDDLITSIYSLSLAVRAADSSARNSSASRPHTLNSQPSTRTTGT